MGRSKRAVAPGEVSQPSSSHEFLKTIAAEEKIALERIKELVRLLKIKYHLSTKDILHLTDDRETLIPLSIFTKELTALETLTKYLKEELQLSYHQIGDHLQRDERNIWHTYQKTKQKYAARFVISSSQYFIPLSVFREMSLSILETLVTYVKEELHLSYHQIAVLLHRNDRTIWTMYQRARKKLHHEQ